MAIEMDEVELKNLEDQVEKRVPKKKKKKGWSLDDMEFPALIMSIGKPKRGKSYLTRYLITYFSVVKPIFKGGIIFCATQELNSDWHQFPEKSVITGYTDEKLKMWADRLKERKTQGKLVPTFIVFDDLMGVLQKSKYFDQFLSTYRHYHVTIFLNNQYLASSTSSTLAREQTSYLFAFKSETTRTNKCIYEWFGQIYDTFDEFKKVFRERTKEPHTAMLHIEGEEDKSKNDFSFRAPKYEQVKLIY
jgi:hypothetical protein